MLDFIDGGKVTMGTLGISFIRKVHKPAIGTPVGRRQSIAVGFDPADFAKINAIAQSNDVGFQEQVRRLCRLALDIEQAVAITSPPRDTRPDWKQDKDETSLLPREAGK
jgi:hypothetical protein